MQEKRRSGSVVVLFSPGQAPSVHYEPPPREWYSAADVAGWLGEVRRVTKVAEEQPPAEPPILDSMPMLGRRGTRFLFYSTVSMRDSFPSLFFTSCEGGEHIWYASRSSMTVFLDALGQATSIAAHNGRTASPTVNRRYHRHEVSCEAPGVVAPRLSTDRAPISEDLLQSEPAKSGWNAEVFTGFVVDSSGRVGTATIRTF